MTKNTWLTFKTQKNLSLFILFLFLAFFLPLSRAGISIFSILILLTWLFIQAKNKSFTTSALMVWNNKPLVWLYSFFIFCIISIPWGNPDPNWPNWIPSLFLYTIVFPVTMLTSLNSKQIKTVLSAFLLGMLVSEIISYGIFFDLWQTKHSIKSHEPVPFMSHIQYSTFLAFTATLLLSRCFASSNKIIQAGYFVYALAVAGNVFISGGRTGQLAFIVAVLALTYFTFKYKFKAILIASIGLVIFLTTAFFTIDSFHNRAIHAKNNIVQIYNGTNYCSSWGIRLIAYPITWEMLKESPLQGTGLLAHREKLKETIANYNPKMSCLNNHTDLQNQFLYILVQFGLVGFALYLIFIWKLIKFKNKSVENNTLKLIFIATFSIFFISEGLIFQFSSALFAFLLALSVSKQTDDIP